MRSPWVGVDLAADQVAWARLLRRGHEVTLSGHGGPAVVREVIAQSWSRCLEAGVDATRPAPRVLGVEETQVQLEANSLAAVVPLLRGLFGEVAHDARHLVLLASAEGLVLWAEGHPSMVEAARDPQFLPGCLCSERAVGTNAIGTALAVDHAVQVFSAEHFNRRLHGWTTAAAPLRDPETSRLLGAVALAGLFRRAHPHTLALVTAAERLVAAHLAEDRARHDRMLQARYLDLVPGHGRGEARSSDATGGYSPLHRPAGLAIGSTSAPAS